MIKAVFILVIVIPLLALIIHSKKKQYGFLKDLIGGGTPESQTEILQIKKEYEKYSSQQLFDLLSTKQLSPKETLIVNQILKERN